MKRFFIGDKLRPPETRELCQKRLVMRWCPGRVSRWRSVCWRWCVRDACARLIVNPEVALPTPLPEKKKLLMGAGSVLVTDSASANVQCSRLVYHVGFVDRRKLLVWLTLDSSMFAMSCDGGGSRQFIHATCKALTSLSLLSDQKPNNTKLRMMLVSGFHQLNGTRRKSPSHPPKSKEMEQNNPPKRKTLQKGG